MITGIRGKVMRREAGAVEITVGPVRLWVAVPGYIARKASVGKPVSLETILLTDETGLHLYGFETVRERDFFRRLLQVNSVGRKGALKAMDEGLGKTLARIRNAWVNDEGSLDGLGPKTSRNVIAELGEEVAKGVWGAVDSEGVSAQDTAVAAMKALGVKEREARAALRKAVKRAKKGATAEQLVREALRQLR
jgi:Holliday junction DNA helicase RuvA